MTALLDPLRRTAGVSWSAAVTVTLDDHRAIADSLDPDAVLPTASIGKLFLLATVLDEIERGDLDPGELLDATSATQVAESGLLQHLDGQRQSVLDLCRFVGAVSDNLATNALIQRVGLDRIASTTRRLGIARCGLHDVVRDFRSPGDPPFLSTGAAGELEQLMRRLPTRLIDLLRLNTDLSMVATAFGLDPLAHIGVDLGVRLFNKTGTQDGTRADVGGVEVGERVATYAVVARFVDSATRRAAVLAAMRAVGERIRDVILRPT